MPRVFKTLLEQNRLIHVLAVGRLPHPVIVDLLGLAGGYEGLWLDQEHAGLTTEQIVNLNFAARANGLGCFVRMPFFHYSLASQNLESGIDGVICSGQEAGMIRAATGPGFSIVCPGIRPGGPVGDDQKRTVGVAEAFALGADAIVVGRPISQAEDPRAAAEAIQREIADAIN